MEFFSEMHDIWRAWTCTIEKVKAAHWKNFLDQASYQTVWEATPYLESRENYVHISPLKVVDAGYTDNHDKACVLMEAFFPATEPQLPELIVPPRVIA